MAEAAFEKIAVIGAGTMGNGIAQVSAVAGASVWLVDSQPGAVEKALGKIQGSLSKLVEKGKLTEEAAAAARARIQPLGGVDALTPEVELVVEAVPERLALKQALFAAVAERVSPTTVLATNTSSLSIAAIASAVPHPERVIGTHFFNPVPIMALLELVIHPGTAPEVLARVSAYGAWIGKECITVQDRPGFATSRLGVALGMEAIRMVEEGVASAEDIDKAMVLGYRHPVGPLRLTDMVGLDVRLAIGTYLASALGNPAFEPPALMKKMVEEGHLGQKTGQGFYRW